LDDLSGDTEHPRPSQTNIEVVEVGFRGQVDQRCGRGVGRGRVVCGHVSFFARLSTADFTLVCVGEAGRVGSCQIVVAGNQTTDRETAVLPGSNRRESRELLLATGPAQAEYLDPGVGKWFSIFVNDSAGEE